MHPDLHRYLDRELPRDALPAELAAEAEFWDKLLAEAAVLRAERAPESLEARIMAALPRSPGSGRGVRVWRWLVEPRAVRVRPVTAILAAAAALALLIGPTAPRRSAAPIEAAAPVEAPPTMAENAHVYVQFVFLGEDARSVAVVGDFNGWDPERNPLRDRNGDGVWTGLVALPPGLHSYMFLVDGERWVTDPRAERTVEDGFGMRNAMITVPAPPRRTS